MRGQGRFRLALGAAILCLILPCVLPTISFAKGQDHVELARVAALPYSFAWYWPCGDCDHDSAREILGTWDGSHERLLICEDTGGNSFQNIQLATHVGLVCDVGDGDGDGLCDVLSMPSGLYLQDWEAVEPDSFSFQPVWGVTPPNTVDYAQFCDLDQDGQKEIVYSSSNGDGIYVYENRGDNQYVEVPFPRRVGTTDIMGQFVVGDFNVDGHTELVGGNGDGDLLVYECMGDDQYARVCSLNYYPNEVEDYRHAVANNLDGDGLPKLISLFRRWNMPGDSCMVRVYGEPVHNQFVCTCSLTYAYNWWFGGGCVAAGDVDGDLVDEFAVSTNLDVRLFKSVGPGQYVQTWQLNRSGAHWMRFYDINRDHREELIISLSDSTYIFEDTNELGTAIFERPPQRHSVSVQPTIARLGASLLFSGLPPGSDIEVHSLDGRLVRRTQGVRQSNWSWNLRNQSGNLVPAGTYFAVIRSKGESTSLKLCLVK